MQNEKKQNITKSEQKSQKLASALKKNLKRRKEAGNTIVDHDSLDENVTQNERK